MDEDMHAVSLYRGTAETNSDKLELELGLVKLGAYCN